MKMRQSLLEALQSVVWYNGLAEEIYSWKGIEPNIGYYPTITQTYFDKYQHGEYSEASMAELQHFWMICVELFGECGTSPRFGWIEDIDSFKTFIDLLTRCGSMIHGENEYEAYQACEDEYEKLVQSIKEKGEMI